MEIDYQQLIEETRNCPCNGCPKAADCATGLSCGAFNAYLKDGKPHFKGRAKPTREHAERISLIAAA